MVHMGRICVVVLLGAVVAVAASLVTLSSVHEPGRPYAPEYPVATAERVLTVADHGEVEHLLLEFNTSGDLDLLVDSRFPWPIEVTVPDYLRQGTRPWFGGVHHRPPIALQDVVTGKSVKGDIDGHVWVIPASRPSVVVIRGNESIKVT